MRHSRGEMRQMFIPLTHDARNDEISKDLRLQESKRFLIG